MKVQYWINWCQGQLADLSLRLFRQGYHPDRIKYLKQTSPEFKAKLQECLDEINRAMNEMCESPEDYQHYENFMGPVRSLLSWTKENRERFLVPGRGTHE